MKQDQLWDEETLPQIHMFRFLISLHHQRYNTRPKEGPVCADSRQISESVKLYLVSCTAKFALPLSAADGCTLTAALGHLVAGSTCSLGLTGVL